MMKCSCVLVVVALATLPVRSHSPSSEPSPGASHEDEPRSPSVDERLVRWANGPCGRWAWLDRLVRFLDSGRPFFAFMGGALLLPLAFRRDRWRRRWLATLVAALLAVTAATAAGRVLAGALPRQPRPLEVLDLRLPGGGPAAGQREALLKGRPDTSMPSTHAITGSAVGLCLVWHRRWLGVLLTAWGCLLMVTPVLYLGLHWPSDVLVSLLLAGVAGWAAARSRSRLVGLARRLDALLRSRPLTCSLGLTLLSALVVWRVTPRLGLMDATTQAVRWVFAALG